MKKALVAAVILILLVLGAVWNLRYLTRLTGDLTERIEASQTLGEAGDDNGARAVLAEAIDVWKGADGYTHIFIRHAEIDAITDAFYDALGAVGSDEAAGAYGKLLSRIRSTADMERVTLKSVF